MDACDASYANKKLHTYVPSYSMDVYKNRRSKRDVTVLCFIPFCGLGSGLGIIGVSTVVASEV